MYEGSFRRMEPNRAVDGVDIRVLDEDCSGFVDFLQPRVNLYPNSAQGIATPAVRTGLFEDLYLSIAGGTADAIVLDVFVFPFIWVLWAGGLIVVAGGFIAIAGRRRRKLDADLAEAAVTAESDG